MKRSDTKPHGVVHKYKADHKRQDQPAKDCPRVHTDAEKADTITRNCAECGQKGAVFKYVGEVKTN